MLYSIVLCFNSLVKVTELIPYQEITKHLILARYFNSSSYNIRDKKTHKLHSLKLF